MPKVTVRAFATLNGLLGSKTMDVFTLGSTIRELIDLIATEYNPQFKDRLIDPKKGEVHKFYRILINGRDIDFLDILETKMKEGNIY
ncbi:MAG: hypothetical protein AOA66_1775 [Candidatus Bathyarchaeota archaeon BA2]|nr:MAG: hypothetical protein AOA66_1775 [Candidatus Bathyarchaeota archaeon BA2]